MSDHHALPPLEVWGGIECTLNRVGDRYHDQLERSGHAARIDDIDRLAALGLRTVRYPVLWERVAPLGDEQARWIWPDEHLERLRTLGIDPIVGLLHHGSGPRTTSLVDPAFPAAFARYARAVAERYPWVRRWTPINEPLTTARFSTLYGHWYPHARDDRQFARAIVGQCRAIGLAMRAIREVRADAELVQTEDLGRASGTPLLAYQVEFENERRWLTFDLLRGELDRGHLLWGFLRGAGIEERELDRLRDEPCQPDLLGINYYLTGERFLDERLEHYPEHVHGSNGRHAYADVEAARVCAEGIGGAGAALAAAWARYRQPVAITEAHLACTREQQLRWLHEVWTSALAQRERGVDVRAVTAWSLFGAFEWQSLVTRIDGAYEPGAFDVRSEPPRPTALAAMVRDLATRGSHYHPVLDAPGWWRSEGRLAYQAVDASGRRAEWLPQPSRPASTPPGRPLLITGATGTVGHAFARACEERLLAYHAVPDPELDVADADAVGRLLDALAPWAVVDASDDPGDSEADAGTADGRRHSGAGSTILADACARRGIALLHLSAFHGSYGEPDVQYLESDGARPADARGRHALRTEREVQQRMPGALIVRSGPCFSPWTDHEDVAGLLRVLECAAPVKTDDAQAVSLTYAPDLADVALDLLVDGERGVWHLTNEGAVARTGLAIERGTLLPPLADALTRYGAARAHHTQTA